LVVTHSFDLVLMDALWSLFALATVILKPRQATAALLMTGINHASFATIMAWPAGISMKEALGFDVISEEIYWAELYSIYESLENSLTDFLNKAIGVVLCLSSTTLERERGLCKQRSS
jgi:hypothetical protein